MKNLFTKVASLFILTSSLSAQTISFTDVNLKTALLNHIPIIDINNNSEIEESEAELVTKLDLRNSGITNLTGLGAFVNLLELNCSQNSLFYISLVNKKLKKLNCSGNDISTLEISSLVELVYLDCSYNKLNSLMIGTLDSLTTLDCSGNSLKNLDLYANPTIFSLTANECSLEWLDVSNLKNLNQLYCSDNILEELDITQNTKLNLLDCRANRLSDLDLSKNTAVMDVNISDNNFITFDFSSNVKVSNIFAGNNPLTDVDLGCLPDLNDFECQNCNLKNLDISGNSLNFWLDVVGNDSLDIICIHPEQNFGYLGRNQSTKISTDCAVNAEKCLLITGAVNNFYLKKELIKTIDFQGREITEESTGLLIEIYSDGSREKVWRQ